LCESFSNIVGYTFGFFVITKIILKMGQKSHPLGVRVKAIENKLFFQKIGRFNTNSLFYSFYSHAFKTSPTIGEKIGQSIIIEKIIISYFIKLLYFVNRVFITETSINYIVLVEFYPLKKKRLFILFIKQNFILQRHFSSLLFDKKKIQFFIVNLSSKFSDEGRSNVLKFKNNFIKRNPISSIFLSLGSISNFWPSAVVFATVFSYFFKKNLEHTKILDFIDQLFFFLFNLRFSQFLGIRLEVKGRLNASDRSKKRVICQGSVPLQSFHKIFLSYGFCDSITPYGVCGIRVFFSYKTSFKC